MLRPVTLAIEAAASGAWATRERLLVYPCLLVAAYLLAGAALLLTGHGDADLSGRLIGADFGMIWSAGRAALEGRPQVVYDLAAQAAAQSSLFGEAAGFTPWHYPPTFLFVAAPLAAVPYLAALALWQGATLASYLAAIRGCAAAQPRFRGPAMLLAAAFPAAFINASHGQNGFLTAALMTGGVLCLRTRPVIAGVLFALLSYKPQFCVLIPVLLAVDGNWRAFASAVVSGSALLAATAVVFGAGVFQAFAASLADAKRLTLETGATGWEKIQSVFAAARLTGGGYDLAMTLQVAAALLVIVAVVIVWRSSADRRLKQALVFPGVLLATPYCLDYDMVLLAPALALLSLHGLERGFARWEITVLAFVYVTPMIARLVGGATHAPLGAVTLLALFAWTWRRARAATSPALRISPAPQLPSAS